MPASPLPHTTQELVHDELEVLHRLVPLGQQRIIELGCGAAGLSRRLLQTYPGCSVQALEVDAIQHRKNLAEPPTPGLTFVAAGAQSIPASDGCFDLALMLKSLHHIPAALMDQSLEEVRRVLRPGGHLYVSEPVFDGPLNEIVRLFNDEQQVRQQAYAAVQRALSSGGWREVVEHHFLMPARYANFEEFEHRMVNVTYADRRFDDALRERVRERFEALRPRDGAPFLRPMRVNLLRKQ